MASPQYNSVNKCSKDNCELHKNKSRIQGKNANKYPDIEGFTFSREERFECAGNLSNVPIYKSNIFSTLAITTGIDVSCSLDTEFALIGGGTLFLASSEKNQAKRIYVEPFLIARTEISQRIWDMVSTSLTEPLLDLRDFKGETKPIEGVSWVQAERFLNYCSMSFPTEAEWEYAARAGSSCSYCFGESINTNLVNFSPVGNDLVFSGRRTTVEIGSLPPNGNGLFEVHGNVAEWCVGNADNIFQPIRGGNLFSDNVSCSLSAGGIERRESMQFIGLRPVVRLGDINNENLNPKFLRTECENSDTPIEIKGFTFKKIEVFRSSFYEHHMLIYECNFLRDIAKNLINIVEESYEFVLIPGGSYYSKNGTDRRFIRRFLIARTEFCLAYWNKLKGIESNPSDHNAFIPIDSVSYDDVQQLILLLDDNFTLPSIEQWEYACRSGLSPYINFSFGNEVEFGKINCIHSGSPFSNSGSVLVNSLESSGYGLFHMHGNLSEWCYSSVDVAPVKGGSWDDPVRECQWWKKKLVEKNVKSNTIGFRLVFILD